MWSDAENSLAPDDEEELEEDWLMLAPYFAICEPNAGGKSPDYDRIHLSAKAGNRGIDMKNIINIEQLEELSCF